MIQKDFFVCHCFIETVKSLAIIFLLLPLLPCIFYGIMLAVIAQMMNFELFNSVCSLLNLVLVLYILIIPFLHNNFIISKLCLLMYFSQNIFHEQSPYIKISAAMFMEFLKKKKKIIMRFFADAVFTSLQSFFQKLVNNYDYQEHH